MPYINHKPPIIINGVITHNKKITNPAKITKIWNKTPPAIRKIHIIAPSTLEKEFDIKVLKNSVTLKPFG